MTGPFARRRRWSLAALGLTTTWVLGVGCAQPSSRECTGGRTAQVCRGKECQSIACRGDELCETGACVPWAQASLQADFVIRDEVDHPLRRQFRVVPGGFPREFADQVRFDFGDDIVGWGAGPLG